MPEDACVHFMYVLDNRLRSKLTVFWSFFGGEPAKSKTSIVSQEFSVNMLNPQVTVQTINIYSSYGSESNKRFMLCVLSFGLLQVVEMSV